MIQRFSLGNQGISVNLFIFNNNSVFHKKLIKATKKTNNLIYFSGIIANPF